MTHLWVRAESRANEQRVGLTPEGVTRLIDAGIGVTVEESADRILPNVAYEGTGAVISAESSWPEAPDDAIIFGIKELPEDGTPLRHRHIMFGHAYKGQPAGQVLLRRFAAGGGTLYDLEYLLDENGRRLAAFGYWAGYAGAAVSLMAWAAQTQGQICQPVHAYPEKNDLLDDLRSRMAASGQSAPDAIIIGAKGRVGTGAADLLSFMGVSVTPWDMAETAHGGPFPQILEHQIFINAILAHPGVPVFVGADAAGAGRKLTVIGDIACDPTSEFSPIRVYDRITNWQEPVIRVSNDPVLDVMAIDNLPSMLPLESSLDYAAQLLPVLLQMDKIDQGPWGRAAAIFNQQSREI